MDIVFLILGFVLLILGAGKLVDGASSLAKLFGIPNIVIGLTVVAFGTSSPELVVNLIASFNNSSQMVLGNVIGSNIFNVLFILGICSMIYPLTVKSNTTWLEIPLSLLAGLVVLVVSSDVFLDKTEFDIISKTDGIILFCFFIIFQVYTLQVAKSGIAEDQEQFDTKSFTKLKSVLFIILGFAGLVAGGEFIVSSAVNIAKQFGISERVIALTIVSVGTSLPELATSVVAARKKNVDIAIGNIVGSNIFNIFFILGVSVFINPIKVESGNYIDIYMNIFAGVLLFIFIFSGKGRKINKVEGLILLSLYVVYVLFLIFKGSV
ncbi:MAG TPA: calcium/sodium antiporter [Ignavibacteria bacterium]|nr:calcium/sodium antiporter [Ignavibacteria bacterium]